MKFAEMMSNKLLGFTLTMNVKMMDVTTQKKFIALQKQILSVLKTRNPSELRYNML